MGVVIKPIDRMLQVKIHGLLVVTDFLLSLDELFGAALSSTVALAHSPRDRLTPYVPPRDSDFHY
jgi:hypothetical protein